MTSKTCPRNSQGPRPGIQAFFAREKKVFTIGRDAMNVFWFAESNSILGGTATAESRHRTGRGKKNPESLSRAPKNSSRS
jgi:hypothetical protein